MLSKATRDGSSCDTVGRATSRSADAVLDHVTRSSLVNVRGRIFESNPDMVQGRPEARALAHVLARYREPDSVRGAFELMITAVPFVFI